MTPQIFPGLKPPTSKLFIDLQDMISANGGRMKLAKTLEIEQLTTFHQREKYFASHRVNSYTLSDVNFIIKNYKNLSAGEIAYELQRNITGVYQKIHRLKNKHIL